jgi:hypothetical protein
MNPHCLVLATLLVVCSPVTRAAAQSVPPRLEGGVHAAFLRSSDFNTTNTGIGGRLSFNFTRWLALEAEGTFFPSDDVVLPTSSSMPDLSVIYERARTDAFFGVKFGKRTDTLGLFVKARPGFTRLTGNGPRCVGPECALILLIRPEYLTEFAMDLGGVVELYPSARTIARFEIGDVLIKHRSVAPPCWGTGCGTTHNLATRIGVGVRF